MIRSNNGLEDQKYFGYFHAIVDGVDFDADPNAITKVSELAELYVSVNGGNAKVGRYDFTTSQIPTLVASIGTSLKPILISLGDREIVDWTEFVQKKFFTIKNTTKDSKNNGWAVAKESGKAWVTSYGNELEGQWALTVTFSDAKNTKASVYKFTNRENTGISFTLPTQTLYYISGSENTYKQGGETYVITPVETTDADGYERLDVKDEMNQK